MNYQTYPNATIDRRRVFPRLVGALLVSMSLLSTVRHAQANDVDHCYSNWQLAPYAASTLSELRSRPGLSDRSVKCTIAGRTGHAAVSYEQFRAGDLNLYAWVCNEDGSDCGVDGPDNVQCMGEARTREEDGTRLEDGSLGYVARVPTIGEEVQDIPMDENANYIPYVFDIRIHCRHIH